MSQETGYFAYLLRLARYGNGGQVVWHISLESPQTRERLAFASLDELCRFLERAMNGQESPKMAGEGMA